MIARLFNPSTASAVFSTDELPEAVHELVLRDIMIPRAASRSMTPTIQKGDRLELGRTDALQAGDVIVYRQNRLFICHRIRRIEGPVLYLKGDACDGLAEKISSLDVVARVTALLRDGRRLAIPPYGHSLNQSAIHTMLDRSATWSLERGRALGLLMIEFVVALQLVDRVLSSVLGRVITVDVMEQAPLQSLTGFVNRYRFQLCRTDRFETYLSDVKTDLSRITLVIRAGPLHLGSCSFDPWHLKMRPLAKALRLEFPLQSFRFLPMTDEPL